MKNILLLLLFCGLCFQNTSAQHIDIDKKALSFLKETDTINTLFSYENILFDPDLTEEVYLEKMVNKITRISDSIEAKNWVSSYIKHKNIWPNLFTNVLNQELSTYKNPVKFVKDSNNVKYSVKINTAWMYFGYDGGFVDRPAKVSLKLEFFESSNPEKILFTTEISRAMGKYNKEDGIDEGRGPSRNRMKKAYVKAAYKFAKALKRVVD